MAKTRKSFFDEKKSARFFGWDKKKNHNQKGAFGGSRFHTDQHKRVAK